MNPECIKLQSQAQLLSNEAEVAVEADDIDKAQEIMEKIDEINKLRLEIVNRMNEHKKMMQSRVGVDVNKKLRACDICGSFLSIFDSDKYH